MKCTYPNLKAINKIYEHHLEIQKMYILTPKTTSPTIMFLIRFCLLICPYRFFGILKPPAYDKMLQVSTLGKHFLILFH